MLCFSFLSLCSHRCIWAWIMISAFVSVESMFGSLVSASSCTLGECGACVLSDRKFSVNRFPWPVQLECSQGKPAGARGRDNELSWGREVGSTGLCDHWGMGSERSETAAGFLLPLCG